MTFKSDATDVESFLTQLVGAASSTRFWDELPENYPYGAGTFLEHSALQLVSDALPQLEKIINAQAAQG